MQLFVYCDLWSKLVSTCSWQKTALKAEALGADSSNCKTLWWKNGKLPFCLKHRGSSSSGELQSKHTSSTEKSSPALVNRYHGKGPRDSGRGWRYGRGWMMFVSKPFVVCAIPSIKLLAMVWGILFSFARDKGWWIKALKQGTVKKRKNIFQPH